MNNILYYKSKILGTTMLRNYLGLIIILLVLTGCGLKTKGEHSQADGHGHQHGGQHDHSHENSSHGHAHPHEKNSHDEGHGAHGHPHPHKENSHGADHGNLHDHQSENASVTQGKATPIPEVVRKNLGITFAKAQYRSVTKTITLPGHFEILPSAQQHYPMPASGRVKVLVAPLDKVKKGQLLLELDAPKWRALQQKLTDAKSSQISAELNMMQAKAAQVAAGDFKLSKQNDVFSARNEAAKAEVHAAKERLERLLFQASTLTDLSIKELKKNVEGQPFWKQLQYIPIRAVDSGIIREVDTASGTWVSENTEVVHVTHPSKLRFRAKALQSDLIDYLRDGQIAEINPPTGFGAERLEKKVLGKIRLGVTGNPNTRTVDVYIDINKGPRPFWYRPQMTAMAEVIISGNPDEKQLSIPLRATIQDGLETVFFRRDSNNPDVVYRTIAHLGPSDDRWVVVTSGLEVEEEVVVDGVYQLKLATTGKKVQAGHFHADGSFHEGED